jgi:hypothetical protein
VNAVLNGLRDQCGRYDDCVCWYLSIYHLLIWIVYSIDVLIAYLLTLSTNSSAQLVQHHEFIHWWIMDRSDKQLNNTD